MAICLKRDDAGAYRNGDVAKDALDLKDEAWRDFQTAHDLAMNVNNKARVDQSEQALSRIDRTEGS